jgi:dynein heavy chain 1, cytosolic
LFNRCIIDWFGTWPQEAIEQVAFEFTEAVPVPLSCYDPSAAQLRQMGDLGTLGGVEVESQLHLVLSETVVKVHRMVEGLNEDLKLAGKKFNFISPRDYLDFINHFISLVGKKHDEIQQQKDHLSGGLSKLRETEVQK